MRRAILKHQHGNYSANLVWGPTLAPDLASQLTSSCDGLSSLGYEVSPFPEGDGVTFTHPQYSKEQALGHVDENFRWLAVTDKSLDEDQLYEVLRGFLWVGLLSRRFLLRFSDERTHRALSTIVGIGRSLGSDESRFST